jgi:hypothetical protein
MRVFVASFYIIGADSLYLALTNCTFYRALRLVEGDSLNELPEGMLHSFIPYGVLHLDPCF